jgi:hypothetical protein
MKICHLILAFSLTLNLADYGFTGYYFYYNQVSDCGENPDFLSLFNSQNVCSEDDIFINDLRVNLNKSFYKNRLVSFLKITIKSNYISNVWRPPKINFPDKSLSLLI